MHKFKGTIFIEVDVEGRFKDRAAFEAACQEMYNEGGYLEEGWSAASTRKRTGASSSSSKDRGTGSRVMADRYNECGCSYERDTDTYTAGCDAGVMLLKAEDDAIARCNTIGREGPELGRARQVHIAALDAIIAHFGE